jgi:hypothetical protein
MGVSIETWCLGKCKGMWWAKAKVRVCGGQRHVVGEGEGVWWAKARGCGRQRQMREGERGTNEGVKSVDGRRSEKKQSSTSTLNTWMLNFCT